MSRPSKLTAPLQGLKTPNHDSPHEVPSPHSDDADPESQPRRRPATARDEQDKYYAIEHYQDEEGEREAVEEDYLDAFGDVEPSAYENQYLNLKDFNGARPNIVDLQEPVREGRGEGSPRAKAVKTTENKAQYQSTPAMPQYVQKKAPTGQKSTRLLSDKRNTVNSGHQRILANYGRTADTPNLSNYPSARTNIVPKASASIKKIERKPSPRASSSARQITAEGPSTLNSIRNSQRPNIAVKGRNHKLAARINIVEQLNGENVQYQNIEMELERLKITCTSLNQKLVSMESLEEEVPRLRSRLEEADSARKTAEQEVELLQKENYLIQEKNQILQQKCDQMSNELKTLAADYEGCEIDRKKTLDQLGEGSQYILKMEEKVYKSNKISLELLKQLKDAEVEIDCLKQYIVDLKSRVGVYIPAREDEVDKRLADYINNHPQPQRLKVLFIRDGPGIYQFGTRRVNLKLEQHGLIKVRVGGGWVSIDEFLDIYTKQEVDKMKGTNRDWIQARRSTSPAQRRQ